MRYFDVTGFTAHGVWAEGYKQGEIVEETDD